LFAFFVGVVDDNNISYGSYAKNIELYCLLIMPKYIQPQYPQNGVLSPRTAEQHWEFSGFVFLCLNPNIHSRWSRC